MIQIRTLGIWCSIVPLVSLGSGCQDDLLKGLDPEVQRVLAKCEHAQREIQEACVRGAMYKHPLISGEQGAIICERMNDGEVQDACWETLGSLKAPYAPDEVCLRIRDDTLADSCHLSLADRLSREHALPEVVVPACKKANSLVDECFFHYAMLRVDYYRENGGIGRLLQEQEAMLQTWPELAQYNGFGRGLAMGASSLQPHLSRKKPCDMLPSNTEAMHGCLVAREMGAYWKIVDGRRTEDSRNEKVEFPGQPRP